MKQAQVLTERDMKRVLQNVTRWKEGRNSYGRYSILKGTIQRYLVPYFGNRDITLIQKKDLMAYRTWRQAYWVTGPGFKELGKKKKPPSQATLKQEWTALRGVFVHGIDLGVCPQTILAALKHDKTTVKKARRSPKTNIER